MTDDEIIAGIQRRADGWDSESASDRVMEQLLKKHGLPLPEHSGFDPEAIAMQAELFELIERWSDAGEAGRTADVARSRTRSSGSVNGDSGATFLSPSRPPPKILRNGRGSGSAARAAAHGRAVLSLDCLNWPFFQGSPKVFGCLGIPSAMILLRSASIRVSHA